MDAAFSEAVRELALMSGIDWRVAVDDEHVRWNLYEASVPDRARRSLLRRAVRSEPNAPLASAVVVRVLEVVPDDERRQWADLLPQGRLRSFAVARSAELHLLDTLIEGGSTDVRRHDIEGWSEWLQVRLAQRIDRTQVLDELSRSGTTKRVRRLARERLDALGSV